MDQVASAANIHTVTTKDLPTADEKKVYLLYCTLLKNCCIYIFLSHESAKGFKAHLYLISAETLGRQLRNQDISFGWFFIRIFKFSKIISIEPKRTIKLHISAITKLNNFHIQ